MTANTSNKQGGFTLIEVLAAMVIFAIAAAGLAVATITTIQANSASRNMSTANSLIQDRIEQFRALDVGIAAQRNQLVIDSGSVFDTVNGSDRVDALGNASANGPFRRSWVVTFLDDGAGNIQAGMVRVDVTVAWNDPAPHSISSTAYVCYSNLCA